MQLVSPPVLQAVADRENDRRECREELERAGHREAFPVQFASSSAGVDGQGKDIEDRKDENEADVHVSRALRLGVQVRAEHAAALPDGHVHRDACRLLRLRPQIVSDYVARIISAHTFGTRMVVRYAHQAMMTPIVV